MIEIALIALAVVVGYLAFGRSKDAPSLSVTLGAGEIARFEFPAAHGPLHLEFDIDSMGYFAAVANGHCGVMARACLPCIDTGNYRGHGIIFGRILQGTVTSREMPDASYGAFAVPESWAVGAVAPEWHSLRAEAISPPLLDGVYHVTFEDNGTDSMRCEITDGLEVIHDTGTLAEDNPALDWTNRNVVFFNIADHPVRFSNITVS